MDDEPIPQGKPCSACGVPVENATNGPGIFSGGGVEIRDVVLCSECSELQFQEGGFRKLADMMVSRHKGVE